MHSSLLAAAVAAGLPLFAGCAGNSTGQSTAVLPALPAKTSLRDLEKALLYVADTYLGEVVVYRQQGRNQQPVRTLTQDLAFPRGVWVDTHDNLWVANTGSSNYSTILRFRKGATKPDLTLSDPYWQAYAVWVASDGSIYVVNAPYSGDFEIIEYPPHKKSSIYIGDSNLSLITSIVGDANGDLFAGGIPSGGYGEIDERKAGSSQWTNTGIAGTPFGLGFDAAGNFVVANGEYIETYPPGKTEPSNSIACTAECVSFAFNHAGNIIWVDEFNNNNGTIDEFRYPSGKLIQSLAQPNGSSPESVATSPNLYP